MAALAPRLPSFDPFNAAIAIAALALFLVLGAVSPQIQFIYFVGITPLLVFLEQGRAPFQLSQVVLMIMLLLLVVEGLTMDRGRAVINGRPEFIVVALFLGWTLALAVVHAISPYAGLLSFLRHGMFLVLWPLAPIFLRDRWAIHAIMLVILVPFVVTVLYGWAAFLLDIAQGLRPYGLGGTYRARSLFPSVNTFGVYLASFTLFFATIIWSRVGRTRAIWREILLLAPTLPLLVVTFSRRAYIAFAVGLVVAVLLIPSRARRRGTVAILVLLALATVVLLPTDVILNPRLLSLTNPLSDARSSQFLEVGRLLGQDPFTLLFGLGVGSSFLLLNRVAGGAHAPIVDNYYMTLWANFGIVAVALYLLIAGAALWRMVRARRPGRQGDGLLRGCIVAVVVMLVSGLAGTTNITFPVALYLPLLLGLGSALADASSPDPEPNSYGGISSDLGR